MLNVLSEDMSVKVIILGLPLQVQGHLLGFLTVTE